MRSSLAKRASKRMSFVAQKMMSQVWQKSESSYDSDGNDLVRFKGVSMEFLKQLLADVFQENVAAGVELVIAKEDLDSTVKEGTTLRIEERKSETEWIGIVRSPLGQNYKVSFHPDKVQKLERNEWTMEDIAVYVVLEKTARTKQIYVDILSDYGKPTDVGQPMQGTFITVARASRFDLLYAALQEYFMGEDPQETFVWIDIFSVNQNHIVKRDNGLTKEFRDIRAEWLTKTLHDGIQNFDSRVIFIDSWLRPTSLQRTYCLWEIWASIDNDDTSISVKPLLTPGFLDEMVEALSNDEEEESRNKLSSALQIDVKGASSFNPDDHSKIISNINKTVKIPAFNEKIRSKVKKWLIQAIQDAAVYIVQGNAHLDQEEKIERYAKLLLNAGTLLGGENALNDEEKEVSVGFFKQSLEHMEELDNKDGQVSALRGIGANSPSEEAALESFQSALVLSNELGQPVVSAEILEGAAIVLIKMKNHAEALTNLQSALALKQEHAKDDIPSIIMTLGRIGDAQMALSKFQDALQTFESKWALDEKQNAQKEIAHDLLSIAKCLEKLEKFRPALKKAQESSRLMKETFGPHDVKTRDTEDYVKSLMIKC